MDINLNELAILHSTSGLLPSEIDSLFAIVEELRERVAELELTALARNVRHGKALGDRVEVLEAHVAELEEKLASYQTVGGAAGRVIAAQQQCIAELEAAEARKP